MADNTEELADTEAKGIAKTYSLTRASIVRTPAPYLLSHQETHRQESSAMKGKWHMVKSLRNAMNAAALFVAGATLLMSKGQALAQAAPPMQDESARIGIFMSDNNLARGVFVTQLVPGGPADKVGLRPGDSILAVDAKRVTSPRELQQVVLQHRPGDALELSVSRGGWLRPFRLTSVGQADLAKLSRPRPATATVPLANPRHAFNVAPPSGAGLPSDAWENVSDPYLRAKYTAFGE